MLDEFDSPGMPVAPWAFADPVAWFAYADSLTEKGAGQKTIDRASWLAVALELRPLLILVYEARIPSESGMWFGPVIIKPRTDIATMPLHDGRWMVREYLESATVIYRWDQERLEAAEWGSDRRYLSNYLAQPADFPGFLNEAGGVKSTLVYDFYSKVRRVLKNLSVQKQARELFEARGGAARVTR